MHKDPAGQRHAAGSAAGLADPDTGKARFIGFRVVENAHLAVGTGRIVGGTAELEQTEVIASGVAVTPGAGVPIVVAGLGAELAGSGNTARDQVRVADIDLGATLGVAALEPAQEVVDLTGRHRGIGATPGTAAAVGRDLHAVGVELTTRSRPRDRRAVLGAGRAHQTAELVGREPARAGDVTPDRGALEHAAAARAHRTGIGTTSGRIAAHVLARVCPAAAGRQRVGGALTTARPGRSAVGVLLARKLARGLVVDHVALQRVAGATGEENERAERRDGRPGPHTSFV